MSGDQDTAQVLAGRRIVVTRARAQAADLGHRLEVLGAEVIYCPAIRVAPPIDAAPFQRAVLNIASYQWLILTSANGVEALVNELARTARRPNQLVGMKLACVGPVTADALRQHGLQPDLIPAQFKGSEIAGALVNCMDRDSRALLIRAEGGDPELPRRLQAQGVSVDEVVAYRSVPDLENVERVQRLLETNGIDAITFTAPSTVTYFVRAVSRLPAGVVLAAIGPETAARLRALGWSPSVVAGEHTSAGLVQAISNHYAALRSESA